MGDLAEHLVVAGAVPLAVEGVLPLLVELGGMAIAFPDLVKLDVPRLLVAVMH